MGRGPSMGSPSSSSPSTPPSSQPQSQPWMSSAQGKVHPPSLPSPQYRPHLRPQTFQQRPHLPQQHQHPLQTTPHPQQIPASQQQQHLSSQSHQSQEHFGQQYPPPRAQQPVQHQHQPMRPPPPALASQKSISPGTVQPGMVQSGPTTMMGSTDAAESGNQILSKRSIHDLVTQKFQGHGMGRITSMGSPSSPSLGTPPGSQPLSQPWMSSAQGKMHQPSLPSPSYRPHMRPQTFQQRPHLPQQHQHPLPTTSHPQQMPTSQQQQHQLSQSHQSQEHYGQQFPSLRAQQPVQHQHQPMRPPVLAGQKSIALGSMQPSMAQLGPTTMMSSTDAVESGNQILSKRSIHELVTQVLSHPTCHSSSNSSSTEFPFPQIGRNQFCVQMSALTDSDIDPSEKLDPEVEDVLVEIAEDFVESITTVACSLAKHRKSTTLEAKDILLHLERNWNMTLPGFSGDEIKSCKKPFMNDIHKERLAAVKKSIVGTDAGNTKASAGQPTASTKGHAAKAPTTGSPKTRE